MISILKENEVVQFGDYQEYYEDSNEVYVYKREYDGKNYLSYLILQLKRLPMIKLYLKLKQRCY